jgi:transposase
MKHVAIDLGSRESQLCVREADGTIVEEGKVSTRSLLERVASWEPRRVILETSSEAFRIADAARSANHDVRVVPATLVKTLGVGARGIKTDRRDARALSEVSRRVDLPSVHVPSATSRMLKSACGSREELVETRTKLINNTRGWLRSQLWRLPRGSTVSFPARVRQLATQLATTIPEHIERNLHVIDVVTTQIKAADKQLRQVASEDPICRLLTTVPGVGPVTAVRFRAALDDVHRFSSSHGVQSYLGLTPGERSSSDSQRRTGITKAGAPATRRMLIQSAWAARRRYPHEPMVQWAEKIAERRGKFIAVVALARKLAGILFAVWRDGVPYRSDRSAAPG